MAKVLQTGNHKPLDPQEILASWASHQAEGVTTIEPTVTAGSSRSKRVRTMSRRMAKSMSHQDFYSTSSLHFMAKQSTTAFNKTPEDLFHNHHLDPKECTSQEQKK